MSKPLHEYTDAELSAELARRASRAPRWGIFIPEQWAAGVEASNSTVALDIAGRMIRGVKYEARIIEPITRPGQVGDEDG